MLGDRIDFVCRYKRNSDKKEKPPFLREEGGYIEWSLDNAYFLGYVEHFGISLRNDIGTFF